MKALEHSLNRSVAVRGVLQASFAKIRASLILGALLGLAIFVAASTYQGLSLGSDVAWASFEKMWKEGEKRDLRTPEFPSARRARSFAVSRPPVASRVPTLQPAVRVVRPVEDHKMVREQRLFFKDLFGFLNKAFSTSSRFVR